MKPLTIEEKDPQTGRRKLQAAYSTQIFALAGLIICLAALWLKIGSEEVKTLYFIYLTGLGANMGAFVWGNRKEYEKGEKK